MVTTSWGGPIAFPRHGPIGAVFPRSGGFPAVQPRRHFWVQKEKLDSSPKMDPRR